MKHTIIIRKCDNKVIKFKYKLRRLNHYLFRLTVDIIFNSFNNNVQGPYFLYNSNFNFCNSKKGASDYQHFLIQHKKQILHCLLNGEIQQSYNSYKILFEI